jgi:hypothetical protein
MIEGDNLRGPPGARAIAKPPYCTGLKVLVSTDS